MAAPAPDRPPVSPALSDTARTVPQTYVRRPARLASLDALRGFDMFWLLGGKALVMAFCAHAPEGTWRRALAEQFTHARWAGFRFYDLIFPLFLFLIGVSIPLSIEKRRARGDSKASILRHALFRLTVMVLLGFLNASTGNLLSWDPSKMGLSYSVLMMLGWGYFAATLLVLYTRPRTQLAVTAAVLVGYWAIQAWLPYPGHARAGFTDGAIFSDWLYDSTVGLLGAPWACKYGRGYPLWMWNVAANTMIGVFAAYVLRPELVGAPRHRRELTSTLLAFGAGLLLLGGLWSLQLPIVKDRWTSSFVLWSCGWAFVLLALFHWVCDVRHWTKWASLFLVLGSNSILAYLIATDFMAPFRALATRLIGELQPQLPPVVGNLSFTLIAYGTAWLLLWYLRQQKIFVRI